MTWSFSFSHNLSFFPLLAQEVGLYLLLFAQPLMAKISQKNQKNTSKPTNKAKRSRRSVPRDSPPQRSSIYRGVTRHRLTGRYEAHLWDKNCWNESQNKKGRQVYLGAYEDEEAAAHAYDLAALKYWGHDTILNFPLSTYNEELKEMEGQSKEEYIGSLRRHHHNGRWEARIGRVFGNKYLYLGTYATQEEAAMAYDMAAIEYRGVNAVTNFDLSRYINSLRPNNTNKPTITLQNPNGDTNSIQNPNQDHGLQSSPSLNDNQTSNVSESPRTESGGPSESSGVGLLFQSSKFKEMLERTSSTDCPSTPPAEPCPARRSFPDDIQTYFDCQDGDNIIFDELDYSFASPIFDCELDMMRVN